MYWRRILAIAGVVALAMFWFGSSPRVTLPANLSVAKKDSAKRSTAEQGCTENCVGHQAGYNWAQDHQVDDAHECEFAGAESKFAAGCREYVTDQKKAATQPEGDNDHSQDDDDQ